MMIAVMNVDMAIPVVWCIIAVITMGILVGLINSFFIVEIGIHSLIVTLGTGTFLNGVVQWISNSRTISGISPALVKYVIVKRFLGIPYEFYYALIVCVLVWYVFQYTFIGRQLLFVGRGRDVSRLSGIRVARVRWGALVASGLLSSFAGVLYAGTTGAADPTSGLSFLLPAFAAAFFGSTSIVPGRFNAWGSFIAVYFLAFGISALTIQGIQTYVQNLFYGGALVLAVTLSHLVQRHRGEE
jgi:ribose transport system permease protein